MKIRVFKPFNLNVYGSGLKKFHSGIHDVTMEEAEHWYTKLHAEIVEEPKLVADNKAKKRGK